MKLTDEQRQAQMPELTVFARLLTIGFIGTEIYRSGLYVGRAVSDALGAWGAINQFAVAFVGAIVVTSYATRRGISGAINRLVESRRADLLLAALLGVWVSVLAEPWLRGVHRAIEISVHPLALPLFGALLLLLASSLRRSFRVKKRSQIHQSRFLSDEEIDDGENDFLEIAPKAESFAGMVLASDPGSGVIFGVDGPWGVGKTSFLNLMQRHLEKLGKEAPIIFRFEPLRYAGEKDLQQRLIDELSAEIQRRVFVPELKPVASRYSRVIKRKADVSLFGFTISLGSTDETVDELLEDINSVLERIARRVIIVIDDLDRLDAKAVDNVLFAVRRVLKLSRATYILCYDTERLVATKPEVENAREFLEKFVTVALSLLVDSSAIKRFLERDWSSAGQSLLSLPSENMLKLSSLLGELAQLLGGELGAAYMPFVGNMRKIKRFVNAVLILQIDQLDLDRTDFNRRDLINLLLLHQNYPGVFKEIYVQETDGRSGGYSARRGVDGPSFINTDEFTAILKSLPSDTARFLVRQLFDVNELGITSVNASDEALLRSRACFNSAPYRNLESYLKLIVKLVTPEPRATFKLYQNAVEKVLAGASISSVLSEPEFHLTHGDEAHEKFWDVLVSRAHEFNANTAKDAIESLINLLPSYLSFDTMGRGFGSRSGAIYSLLRLLDAAGWGRTDAQRLPNTPENIAEIAWRIFGDGPYMGRGLIHELTSEGRGVLGWNDLMIFRVSCSADRLEQLYNLQRSLLLHANAQSETTGPVRELAREGMRQISQVVFQRFRGEFINRNRNFFEEVDAVSESALLGAASASLKRRICDMEGKDRFDRHVATARSTIKNFVIYQLGNRSGPNGSGVGCGFYDEIGSGDLGGIGLCIDRYVFEFCFNPKFDPSNIRHFADFCLSNLSSNFFLGTRERGFVPTKDGLAGGLGREALVAYWREHSALIRGAGLLEEKREVVTMNYVVSYEMLGEVFLVLDELVSN